MKEELLLQRIKERVRDGLLPDFTGLGIIVIDNAAASLPISSLLKTENNLSAYKAENEIVDFLFKISSCVDKRHDGFHIVSKEQGLLKISQYFSPPIPKSFDKIVFDVGARYRTAQYGSLCKNVVLIIVVGKSGSISIARNGLVENLGK
ncbi:MAG: diadenylate cyclase [Methylobacter sp.]